MAILLCFFLVLLLTLVSSIFLTKKLKNSKFNLPPSPSSLPIIGNLHHLSGLLHRCFHNLSIKHGPVMLLRLGFVPVVVISSSEAAEAVLRTHDLECCSRPKTVGTGKLTYGFKDISFSQYGAYWREMRKIAVIELLSLEKVQSFRYIREEEVGYVVKKVSESALIQSPVDLSKTFFSLNASIICRVALGQNFHVDGFVIDQERIEELVTEAAVALGTFTFYDFFPGGAGRFLDWLFQRNKKINRVSKELDDFYQHVIDDHLKPEGRKNKDIVSLLLDMIDKQGDADSFKLNMDNIKAVVMDVFLAGIDTSSIAMIWAMTELIRNPRVMKKAQESIRTTLGIKRERITEDDLGKVEYLNLIIKETFRLHPPLPFIIPRETMSHIKIQGYDIPPKTQIQVNVWAIGRDPQLWTDPEDFIPERFANSFVDFRGQHFELLPFGSGRRMCPAMPMGAATVELGLMNLLYLFDWELPDGMKIGDIDMEEYGNLSIIKKVPLQLVPLRRY
ncbi:Cytochrome P450 71B2 [Raphanus sativus]|uniref:Cytochrome P450 71B2 n=1 Tax=Raphanus sativus TaxID=3726 RepID=A0A6J0LG22_RAPSA|nr:cytochrome P450 71B2 [Raphanus sativus]KAJ4889853.1 Cytochrome P450 71B2 [Raphanus sativus]